VGTQVERARSAAVAAPRSGLEFERSWSVFSNDTTAQLNLLKVHTRGLARFALG
jgi:hypothetical protein